MKVKKLKTKQFKAILVRAIGGIILAIFFAGVIALCAIKIGLLKAIFLLLASIFISSLVILACCMIGGSLYHE